MNSGYNNNINVVLIIAYAKIVNTIENIRHSSLGHAVCLPTWALFLDSQQCHINITR